MNLQTLSYLLKIVLIIYLLLGTELQIILGLVCSLKSNKHTCERETTLCGRVYGGSKNRTVFTDTLSYLGIYM